MRLTWDGDLRITNGDISTSLDDQTSWIPEYLGRLLKSSTGDWREAPWKGANIDEFIGMINDRVVGNAISARVKTAIAKGSMLSTQDVETRVIPISKNSVLITMKVDALSTVNNSLRPGRTFQVTWIFEYSELGVVPMAGVRE
ncbi:unnamed protein product [marine sediment metagenome]|uniref:Uncharacterized protein n=1 Tax=marine sediment metagenome TaxID=412755 RepID=X1SK42_9ZZZZ